MRHAQAAILKLCTSETIIVGHSVHNDLKSLRLSHNLVIDTAYLYSNEKRPNQAPSLRDVSTSILGNKISDIHDSAQDARAALHAAMYLLMSDDVSALTKGAKGDKGETSGVAESQQLLVHRIPEFCTEAHISQMILDYAKVVPAQVLQINRGNVQGPGDGKGGDEPRGKTTVEFTSDRHAALAFDSIVGPNRPDKSGRDQKRIYFKSQRGGGYICVRKFI